MSFQSASLLETTVKRTYIGLVHKDPESDYGVSFPDLLGHAGPKTPLEKAENLGGKTSVTSPPRYDAGKRSFSVLRE